MGWGGSALIVRQTIDNFHTMLEGFGLGDSAVGGGSVGGAAKGPPSGVVGQVLVVSELRSKWIARIYRQEGWIEYNTI